jgi:hypothetical protein
MKEARGGKQLSGKDLIELGLSSSDKEEAKGLRKMRDGCAKLYDAKNEGTKEMFIAWVEEHDSFAYATIWDAVKILEGIANRKFDDDEQFSIKEVEEIAMLIGLEVMPKDMIAPASAPAEEQKVVNQ